MCVAFAEAASQDGSYRTGDGIVTPPPVFLRRHLRNPGSSGRKHRSNLSDGGVAKAWGREAALDGVIARKGRKVLTWQSVLFHETNSRILLLRPSCQGCGLPRRRSRDLLLAMTHDSQCAAMTLSAVARLLFETTKGMPHFSVSGGNATAPSFLRFNTLIRQAP